MRKPLTFLPLLLSPLSLEAADTKVTYQDNIRPLFENRCFNCHNPDKAKGGLDLTTYTNTMAGGASGEVIIPGSAADSRLYKSVDHSEDPKMPPEGDKLPKAELDLIAAWINTGVLETGSSTARKPKKPAFDLSVQKSGPGKPEGPPPMPEHLLLEPPVVTYRASAQADIASSPWAPLVALTGQKQVLLYNTDNHQLAGVLPFPEGFPESLAFSRNGSLLLAAGGRGGKSGRVVVWDVKSGKRVIEAGEEFDTILAADITSDNSLIALGGPSRRIKIYRTADGSELISIKKHTDWVTAMSFSPDGVLLATGDRNGGLLVWEAATGNPFYTLKAHEQAITAITWRADSNIVASASEDGSIRLWEMNEGNQVKNWTGHGGGVSDLDFTHDGHLVSVGRDSHAKIWDQNGSAIKDVTGFGDLPLAVAFSHDGKKFITGDWVGNVHVWDSESGMAIANLAAAPPSIETRLAELGTQIETQRPIAAAAAKRHADIAATIPAVESRGSEAQQQIGALTGQRQAADTELQGARKAIADATAARDQASAEAKPAHEAQIQQANAALGVATGKIAAIDQGIADANAALKARQEELEASLAEAEKAKAEMDSAAQALANLIRQQQFWIAAQINTQRLAKADELAKQSAELEFLNQDLAAADKLIADAQAALNAAEQAAAEAPGLTAARQAALTDAEGKIPAIEERLRLSAVVVDNKRVAVENFTKIEPNTEGSEPLLAAAAKELEDAEARHKAGQDELVAARAAIGIAQSELTNAQQAQAAAPAAIESAKAALVSAQSKKSELEMALPSKAAATAELEAATSVLWNNYQAALPK